jgi:eukaryotic-like serine/threonine-protein kinase
LPTNPSETPVTAFGGIAIGDARTHRFVGRVIAGQLRVDALLDEGGMGAILRCHQLAHGRDVAVKVLHPELNEQPEHAARFVREAVSASRLDHPNCVRVLGYGEWQPDVDEPAVMYLVMELLAGRELSSLLVAPIEPLRAIDYAQQIVAALTHAHERGVVHRDLKPENVLVTRAPDGREVLKLLDFGIAKLSESAGGLPRLTQKGCVFGTPVYMSPEQANGLDVDTRADLYSLGVILYEMASGRLPYRGDDLVELMHRQVKDPPDPMPTWVPARLRAIVLRLMAKNPDDRYPSAIAVHAALDDARRDLERAQTPMLAAARRLATALSSLPSLLGRRTKRTTVP